MVKPKYSYLLFNLFLNISLLFENQAIFTAENVISNDDTINIHFYDLGIRQKWTPQLKIGDSFIPGKWPEGHTQIRSENTRIKTPQVAQFILPMPKNHDIDNLSKIELETRIYNEMARSLETSLKQGKKSFEIQIIENIGYGSLGLLGNGSYFDSKQQERVKKFADCTGAAIKNLVNNIENRHNKDVNLFFTGASNGSVLITEMSPKLASIKDKVIHVDLVEGRANLKQTYSAIRTLGENKFSISSSYQDFFAPYLVKEYGKESIANLNTLKEIKVTYPKVRVFYTVADKFPLDFIDRHIRRAANPSSMFSLVKELQIEKNNKGNYRFSWNKSRNMSGEEIMYNVQGEKFYRAFGIDLNQKTGGITMKMDIGSSSFSSEEEEEVNKMKDAAIKSRVNDDTLFWKEN